MWEGDTTGAETQVSAVTRDNTGLPRILKVHRMAG